jgi:Zn-dependent peptidase ImmA (M78 family)
MKRPLPINPQVLIWARTTLGLSTEDVAARMSRKEEEVLAWESGEDTPTYPQLERLAYTVLKRPIAVFFFPNPPEEDTPTTEFRSLPTNIIETLPPEMITLYRKAKVFQLNLAELFEGSKPIEPSLIDKYSMRNADAASLARKARAEVGYSMQDQISWPSHEIAFKNWRSGLEKKGIFVFKDAFRQNDYSGFCVYDSKYPVIFINNSMPDARQIFTLFHELAHLLYQLGGVDFRENYVLENVKRPFSTYERNCNRFAAEFLIPGNALRSQELVVSEEAFRDLANAFKVSREVVLRRYLDLGIVNRDYYQKMVDKWAKAPRRPKRKGGHYYHNIISYLGPTYINLVFRKYYQNRISLQTLASYLNIKETSVLSFEHYALK